jgi:pimeloyl-ACP methyl ester carboxylesterase
LSTLIFVHGACVRDASWWWSRMTEPLARHGIASVAVALPSCGEAGKGLGDLYDDVEATRQATAHAEPPVALLGHSYGGMVITEAGADERISLLLYVTSMMPVAGQPLAELVGSQPTPWMDPGDDGTVGVHARIVRELFLQDCDDPTVREALARLTRQSVTPFTQPAREIAWQEKPATYIVCTEDLAVPAALQRRRATPADRVIDFPSGHHPFLSRPEALSEVLATEIDRVPR